MKSARLLSLAFTTFAGLAAVQGCARQQGFPAPADASTEAKAQPSVIQSLPVGAQAEKKVIPQTDESVCTFKHLKDGLEELGWDIYHVDGFGMDEKSRPYVDFTAQHGGSFALGHATCDIKDKPSIKVKLYDTSKYKRI